MRNNFHRTRWLIYGALLIPYMIVYFHRVGISAVADSLMADFSISGAMLGNMAAAYFYIYTIMQLPSGLLADYWGPRKTVTLGGIVAGLGSILFGLAPGYSLAFLGRLLAGLGVSVIFIPILKIQAEWFHSREFGRITGLTMFAGNLGQAIAATPLALFVAYAGWRMSFEVIGLISIVAAAACWLLVRDTPEQLGFSRPQTRMDSKRPPLREALLQVISNKATWPPFFSFLGIYGSLMAFVGMWGIPYFMQVFGMSKTAAANYMVAVSVGLMLGSPLIGFISDFTRRRKRPYFIFALFHLLMWVYLIFRIDVEQSPFFQYIFYFLFGVTGSACTLSWACGKEVNAPAVSGTAMGIVNMGGFLGAAILQPLVGLALDSRWEGVMEGGVRMYSAAAFQGSFMICLFMNLLAVLFAWMIRETYCENQYQKTGRFH